MAIEFIKEKVVVEDIELSLDSTVDQSRGTLTPFNAAYLPYETGKSVKDGLDERVTLTYAQANFAAIGGSASQVFKVADGSAADDAVNKGQLDATATDLDSRKVEEGTVLRIDIDNPPYTPQYSNSPATKGFVEAQIADKFLGAVTGKFIAKNIDGSGTDVTVTVTNGVITGIV